MATAKECLLLLLSHFSHVRLCATPQTAAHQVPPIWDSPGKNTGVGCHFLLQCMKVKSESEVTQSCLTPSDPMDCSPTGSSVHGIFQARVLEWGAIAFSVRCLYLSFSPLLFAFLLFTTICKTSPDSHFAFLHFFSVGMVLIPVSCTSKVVGVARGHQRADTLKPYSQKTSPSNGICNNSKGFPGGASGKESTCQCRRCRFSPWIRKIPWRRKWQPTPVLF